MGAAGARTHNYCRFAAFQGSEKKAQPGYGGRLELKGPRRPWANDYDNRWSTGQTTNGTVERPSTLPLFSTFDGSPEMDDERP